MPAARRPGHLTPVEQKLLKMPASSYMNAEQTAFFQARLETMRQNLLDASQDTLNHLRESVALPDINDRATHEEELALEYRVRDRERKLLRKVEQALVRLRNGEYGYCEVSGQPIGLARLLARPTATLCIEEQDRHERLERNYGEDR